MRHFNVNEQTQLLQENGSKKDEEGSSVLLQKAVLVLSGVVVGVLSMFAASMMNGSHGSTTTTAGGDGSEWVYPLSRYEKFQALGFQIYTGGAPAFIIGDDEDVSVNNPECDELSSFGHIEGLIQCYLGRQDPMQDVEQRLGIMKDAVERAYELSDNDPETLKIFIAPEFFWRGKDGAYVFEGDSEFEDVCSEVCQIMSGLEAFVAQKRFQDWLFIFGTIIVSEILPTEDEFDYLFYNFAPVYKGYDPSTSTHHGKQFIVPKRYVSNIDFLTPGRAFNNSLGNELIQSGPISDNAVLNPYDMHRKKYDREMWHIHKKELVKLGYIMIEYDWLIMDGITFTIEVCLDHDMQTALSSYLADAVKGSPARIPCTGGDNDEVQYVPIPKHQAQISLVSSSGMTVNPAAMALMDKGTIILQDGQESEECQMKWEDECQLFSWHFSGGTEAIQRFSVFSPTEAVFEYDASLPYKKHDLYKDENWKDEFVGVFSNQFYEPKITVYKPRDIAKAPMDANNI
jgi:hypothetical protein